MILVRKGFLVEIWYGLPNEPESDFIGSFHYTLCKETIAAIKKFEQSEGR
jgi:hypothetical protein